jgi:hypothetical protein
VNKVHALRAHLVANFDWLAQNPQALSVFVKEGRFGDVLRDPGEAMYIGYAYTARILLIDFAGDLRELSAALWEWIDLHQPDVAQNAQRRESVRFEVELLDNDTADVQIDVPLTESAKFTARDGGGFVITDVVEPTADPALHPGSWGAMLNGQQVVPFPRPTGGG